jgi:hypothetical protein
MIMDNKIPMIYTFNKNAEPQFNLPDVEPKDHFSLFIKDEF